MTRPAQPTLFDNPPVEPAFKLLPLDQYDVIAVLLGRERNRLTIEHG